MSRCNVDIHTYFDSEKKHPIVYNKCTNQPQVLQHSYSISTFYFSEANKSSFAKFYLELPIAIENNPIHRNYNRAQILHFSSVVVIASHLKG